MAGAGQLSPFSANARMLLASRVPEHLQEQGRVEVGVFKRSAGAWRACSAVVLFFM